MSIPLAYSTHGSVQGFKKAIVILHGLFGSSRNWRTISNRLFEISSQPVYVVDLRNHGMTYRNCGPLPMNWNLMSEDIACLLLKLNHPEYTLVGHSFGGQVLMQGLSLGCKVLEELIKKLVIVDVAPKPLSFVGSHISKLLDRMIELDKLNLKSRKETVHFMSKIEPSDSVVQFLLSNGSIDYQTGTFKFNIPLEVLRDEITKLQNTYDSFDRKKVIITPALFIKGGASNFIRVPSDVEMIDRKFPNSTVHTIEGTGHWPHHEKPEEIIKLITDFCSN